VCYTLHKFGQAQNTESRQEHWEKAKLTQTPPKVGRGGVRGLAENEGGKAGGEKKTAQTGWDKPPQDKE